MRFFIRTLGCKTNQSESDHITRRLLLYGYDHTDDIEDADIYIVNTCTVTSTTDKKTRQLIRRIKRSKKAGAEIFITGCYVKHNRGFLEEVGVDHIIDNTQKEDIPDIISNSFKKGPAEKPGIDISKVLHTRHLIKIQEGCSQNCAYCIVPKVRGAYKSVEDKSVIKEIQEAAIEGYEEVVLTGTHIGKYLTEGGTDLNGLLKKIFRKTKIRRVRLSSLEINELSLDLIHTFKENIPRLAMHFHIPMQSGSDRILRLMRRPYTSKEYAESVSYLLGISESIALTTDIIVGFPGEKKEDFTSTIDMVRELPFSKLHVFKFSARKNTLAYDMKESIDEGIKKKRVKRLIDIGKEKRKVFLYKNMSKILDVVVERYDNNKKVFTGTSGNYIKVYCRAKNSDVRIGEIVKVSTIEILKDGLKAKLVKD